MNDELSKALDGAMADAAEMGELETGKPHPVGNDFCCNVLIDGGWDIACYGDTPAEALRRARLIVESVNGRAAMAKRIAELEGALKKSLPELVLGSASINLIDGIKRILSEKGGA